MQSDMVLCFCYGVTWGEIQAQLAQHNPQTLMELIALTKAGNGCGSCWGELESLLDAYQGGTTP